MYEESSFYTSRKLPLMETRDFPAGQEGGLPNVGALDHCYRREQGHGRPRFLTVSPQDGSMCVACQLLWYWYLVPCGGEKEDEDTR